MHIWSNFRFFYKKYLYKDKQKKIDGIFIEYLVPVMDNLDHTGLIEEWRQILDAAAYEKTLNQDVKLPSKNKTTDCNNKTEYCPTSIK